MNKEVSAFVEYVMRAAGIDNRTVTVLDFDLDRVYLAVDSTENNYDIRTWNIDECGITYTLFKFGEEVERILGGYYPHPEKQ